jgi:hypothetical protein
LLFVPVISVASAILAAAVAARQLGAYEVYELKQAAESFFVIVGQPGDRTLPRAVLLVQYPDQE